MVAFQFRPPAGIPGMHTRHSQGTTIETQVLDATNQPTSYGLPVVLNPSTGAIRAVIGGDTASAVYGVNLRPYPSQGGNGQDPLGVSTPPSAGAVSVLRRGYVMVKLNGATAAAKGGAVYVRVAAAATGKPIGGFEAASDSTNTITLTNATFTGPADANGNTEIAFNI